MKDLAKAKSIHKIVGKVLLLCSLFFGSQLLYAQETQKVNAEFAKGNFISEVRITVLENDAQITVDDLEMEKFYNAFFIKPGTAFNPLITDLALKRIEQESNVISANYQLFDAGNGTGSIGRAVLLHIYVELQNDKVESKLDRGFLTKNRTKDFPLLYENSNAQVKLFLNGGAGLFNDVNPFFSQGEEFTSGNPVADKPSGKETRFWAEAFLEPGISAISKLGKSNIYAYGEVSGLISGRNSTDVYSSRSALYTNVERLYGGLLITGLGKKNNVTINADYGRNFFQLNDGFLVSRISGSANAGERGSVYLSSRTAFQKNGNFAIQYDKFRLSANFIEPQELFKNKQLNTNYTIGTFNFNDNKNLDLGISYIETTGGTAKYGLPEGAIAKKGMYIVNPKLWISNIGKTDLFFKSEFAYQSHHHEDMRSYAWYTGLGYNFKNIKTTPSVYYRYAFLKGDDDKTETYERFDPVLTGGLGNWVQGLNFRKLAGNGNIVSHRIEVTSWISEQMALSFDYFNLTANQLNNIGGLAPIANLKNRNLGQEATLTLKGLLKKNLTLLGIVSYAIPGNGIKQAFPDEADNWLTVQGALFINY